MPHPTSEVSGRRFGHLERFIRGRFRYRVPVHLSRLARIESATRFRIVAHFAAVLRKRHVLLRGDQLGKCPRAPKGASFIVIPFQVLPIENKMYNPQNFLPLNGVMNTSCFLVLALYAAVGFFGYIRFGDQIAASITLNMPQNEP